MNRNIKFLLLGFLSVAAVILFTYVYIYQKNSRLLDVERNSTADQKSFSQSENLSGSELDLAKTSAAGVGVNLGFQTAYEPEWKFKDIFEHSRPFNLRGRDFGGVGSGCLDADGWPVKSPCNGQTAQTIVFEAGNWNQIAEAYKLKMDGSGVMTLSGGASGSFNAPGTYDVEVSADRPINISFTSDEKNPLKNVDFVPTRFFNNYKEEPYYPGFMSKLSQAGRFSVIRFMDSLETNNSISKNWNERRTLEGQQQSGNKGMAIEHIYGIVNRVNAAPWINIPHAATDDYIRNFAILLKRNLNQDLPIHIEWSNEVWNSLFGGQYKHANEKGIERGFTDAPRMKYYVARSLEVKAIFEEVFAGEKDRVKLHLAWQASLPSQSDRLLSFMSDPKINPKGLKADYLSGGFYFGARSQDIYKNNLESEITVDQILDLIDDGLTEESVSVLGFDFKNISLVKRVADNKAVADKYGLKLSAYEAGQALVANVPGVPSSRNTVLTSKFDLADQDPRMKEIYLKAFDIIYDGGVEFANHYKFVNAGDQYGYWGLFRWTDQGLDGDYSLVPRWAAVQQFITSPR